MNISVTKKIEVLDGLHKGVIVDVEYREKPYKYTDLIIELMVETQPIRLKSGYPTIVSDSSKLGKILTKFGAVLTVGADIDPNKVLIGKPCLFQTITEDTKAGTFARVLPDSVKPAA